jgi:hypothetical protein
MMEKFLILVESTDVEGVATVKKGYPSSNAARRVGVDSANPASLMQPAGQFRRTDNEVFRGKYQEPDQA